MVSKDKTGSNIWTQLEKLHKQSKFGLHSNRITLNNLWLWEKSRFQDAYPTIVSLTHDKAYVKYMWTAMTNFSELENIQVSKKIKIP